MASDIICSTYFDNDSLWTHLIAAMTTQRFLTIYKTSKGLWFVFVIAKESGIIKVTIQRHRNNVIVHATILNHSYERVSNDVMFFQDCGENWIKVLLFEYGDDVVNYLKRFSAKNTDIRRFVQRFMINECFKLVVQIDIPGFIMII